MSEGVVLPSQPKRILLPRFDAIGDIILLEGFLEALGLRFPDARVTVLIRRAYADLAHLFPDNIDWLVTEVDPHKPLMDATQCRVLLECVSREACDLVLTTSYSRTWADDLVSAAIPGAMRIAFSRSPEASPLQRRLFVKLGLGEASPYDALIDVAEESHEIEKYQTLWQAMGETTVLPEPRLRVGAYQAEVADRILAAKGLRRKDFCLCFPAGTQNHTLKVWPEERFAEIVTWLEKRHGIVSLIAGHCSEIACLERVRTLAVAQGAHPKIWTGRDGELPVLAALSEAAKLYFGNDTGPMHIAAAVQTPVVALFGGGHWPRFAPRGEQSLVIVGEMPCFGCGWDCIFKDAPCMRLSGVEDAKQAIEAHFQGLAGTRSPSRVVRASKTLDEETRQYIERAVTRIRNINQDRNARLGIIAQLESRLQAVEADRATIAAECKARLELINKLHGEISVIEADRKARLELIDKLHGEISVIEADRKARLGLIEKLGSEISAIEADRVAHLELIDKLSAMIATLEGDLHCIRSNFLFRVLAKLRLVPSP